MKLNEARILEDEAVRAWRLASPTDRLAASQFSGLKRNSAALVLIQRGERPRDSAVDALARKLIRASEVVAAAIRAHWATDRHANMPGPTERGTDAAS